MTSLLWIELVGTPLVLLTLVLLGGAGRRSLAITVQALRWSLTTSTGLRTTALLALVLGTNLLQSAWDPHVTAALGYDLTPHVFALEGDAVAAIQRTLLPLTPHPLRLALSVFYLAGFVATLLLPFTLHTRSTPEDASLRRAWFLALAANYVLALPFYLFVPVAEVGWFDPASARPILEEVLPGLTAALRHGSALDNCFPSLHVSCTVTAWWCGRRLRTRGLPTAIWTRAAALSASLTALAVVLLGIHWITDAAAGLLYGILCAELGLYLSASQRAASRA